jgi:hypothetical protein
MKKLIPYLMLFGLAACLTFAVSPKWDPMLQALRDYEASWATWAGSASNALFAGYATNAGWSANSTNASYAGYATNAGWAAYASNLIVLADLNMGSFGITNLGLMQTTNNLIIRIGVTDVWQMYSSGDVDNHGHNSTNFGNVGAVSFTENGTLLSGKYLALADTNAFAAGITNADKSYADGQDVLWLALDGSRAMSGDLNAGGQDITNVFRLFLNPIGFAGIYYDEAMWLDPVANVLYSTATNANYLGGVAAADYALDSDLTSYLLKSGGALSGSLAITGNLTVVSGIISNTVIFTKETALIATNVFAWSSVSIGPWPYEITLTKLYAQCAASTATVYVGELPAGSAFNAALAVTNNSILCETTNCLDTTFSDATVAAGTKLLFWLDNAATDYGAGTNRVDITIEYTQPRL